MTVGKAIYYLLTNASDVTAIVGTRIYPEVAQQNAALPYIVYNVSNNEPSDTKREPSKLDTAEVEVNVFSEKYTQAIDMGVAVRAALDRVKGTYSGVNVQSIQYINEIIDFDEPQRAYNITADYEVRISRTDFEIAQGSPITGVTLGELSDVSVAGVTDNQILSYDAATGNWVPADDAGGLVDSVNGLTGTVILNFDDLNDVDTGTPSDGQLIAYQQGEWVTIDQDEIHIPINSVTGLQTELNTIPTDLSDLSDVSIVGTPAGNQALIYNSATNAFTSQDSYTNRFQDEVETGKQGITGTERAYSVKGEGDGVFIDPESDTPAAGKVIVRKIYHKTGFITDADVIGDYTLIHTFADDTAYADTVATFEGFEDGATYGVPPFTLLQTWEEVAAAPTFTGLLNESYGSGAEAAYSTRRLNGNITECMVIRRASDSTTQTIGFDANGNIDEAAINTFCSGTSCTVYQWLDQSGNGNTATAPSTGEEPTIYTGGAIVKENGKVAVNFDGTNDNFISTYALNESASSYHGFVTANAASGGGSFQTVLQGGRGHLSYDSNDTLGTNIGQAGLQSSMVMVGVRHLVEYLWNNSTGNLQLFSDGNSVGQTTETADRTATDMNIGSQSGITGATEMNCQEIVLYASDKSSDRTQIESNIGDYFTQNTPLLDTYTGAAAAYSLRKLSSSYSGSAIRVRRSSDNTEQDINFNVFGELDTVSLLAFAGAGDAFVKTWYSQTGSNDATQTATGSQPQIVSSGAVITRGTENKPSVLFTGSTQILPIANSFNNNTYLYVGQPLNRSQGFGDNGKSVRTDGIIGYRNYSFEWAAANLYVLHNGTVYDATSGGNISVNLGFDVVLFRRGGVGTQQPISIGREGTQYISEIISYSTLESDSNLVGISNNANEFYQVFS